MMVYGPLLQQKLFPTPNTTISPPGTFYCFQGNFDNQIFIFPDYNLADCSPFHWTFSEGKLISKMVIKNRCWAYVINIPASPLHPIKYNLKQIRIKKQLNSFHWSTRFCVCYPNSGLNCPSASVCKTKLWKRKAKEKIPV